MPEVKVKIDGVEKSLSQGVTTIGRNPDNDIAFPGDANVSRYHAEIESRGSDFYLIDLGSSNGTTINGARIIGEKYLSPGDVVELGGTSRFEFGASNGAAAPEPEKLDGPETDLPAESPDAPAPEAPTEAAAAAGQGGSKTMLFIAGGVACLALLLVGIAGAVFFLAGSSKADSTPGGGSGSGGGGIFSSFFGSGCEAKASITKPEPGDTISAPTEIEVNVEGTDCVAKAIFTIDGNQFASSEAPFSATIDPKDFPELSDGVVHNLGVVLLDEENNPIGENAPVQLAFETRAVTKPSPGPEITQTNTQQGGTTSGSAKAVTLLEVQEMSNRLIKQFPAKSPYNVSNKQFLAEVQKQTAEYAREGYFEKATRYKDVILTAFTREKDLPAPLGFVLAMSRSKFDPAMVGSEEGLWRMNSKFVSENGYDGTCAGVPFNDASQSCAAKAAANYLKFIVTSSTGDDPIFGVAAFGKSTNDAAIWFSGTGQNRTDLWNAIRTAPEREQLVRFFAAGIVTENPQKFGLKRDQPLSTLYRGAM